MTKREQCEQLLTNPSLRSLALKLAGELHNDLIQEVAVVMLEQEKDISSYFEFWCVRTMINMTSKNGTFWKLYSERYLDYNELRFQHELDYDPNIDKTLDKIDEVLDGVYWYKRELFKTYLECGTYRDVERLTGIDHCSVYQTVKEVKRIVRNDIDSV